MKLKRIKPKYPSQRRWVREVPIHREDNYGRRYSNFREGSLEDTIREIIRKERDDWRTPYVMDYINEEQLELPESERKYEKVHWTPEEKTTIREALTWEDSKFRNGPYARRCQYVRVPSLKRTNKEWENFYRTFPWIAKEVALGNTRYCDGAKLKYIPLFKKILDEEWPEDLKMWTDKQYEELIRKGVINTYDAKIIKNLID